MGRVEPAERKKIVALLKEHDGNRNRVAKLCKRSVSTVQGIAVAENIEPNIRAPKNANRARRDYAKAERLTLLNKGFDKADDLLTSIKEAKELQAWMVAVATGIDKRRLEDGEATERSERVDPERRKRIYGAVDELERLRRLRGSNTG